MAIYTLVPDQLKKTSIDDVEVLVTTETIREIKKTPGELKREIEMLNQELSHTTARRASLETELAAIEAEAARYEIE